MSIPRLLQYANKRDEWTPPTPYTVVFAKKLSEEDRHADMYLRMGLEQRGFSVGTSNHFVNAPYSLLLRHFTRMKGDDYDPAVHGM
jgi:hypothetical protein